MAIADIPSVVRAVLLNELNVGWNSQAKLSGTNTTTGAVKINWEVTDPTNFNRQGDGVTNQSQYAQNHDPQTCSVYINAVGQYLRLTSSDISTFNNQSIVGMNISNYITHTVNDFTGYGDLKYFVYADLRNAADNFANQQLANVAQYIGFNVLNFYNYGYFFRQHSNGTTYTSDYAIGAAWLVLDNALRYNSMTYTPTSGSKANVSMNVNDIITAAKSGIDHVITVAREPNFGLFFDEMVVDSTGNGNDVPYNNTSSKQCQCRASTQLEVAQCLFQAAILFNKIAGGSIPNVTFNNQLAATTAANYISVANQIVQNTYNLLWDDGSTTTTQQLTSGTPVSTINVVSIQQSIPAGTQMTIGNQTLYVTTVVNGDGNTYRLSVANTANGTNFTPTQNYSVGTRIVPVSGVTNNGGFTFAVDTKLYNGNGNGVVSALDPTKYAYGKNYKETRTTLVAIRALSYSHLFQSLFDTMLTQCINILTDTTRYLKVDPNNAAHTGFVYELYDNFAYYALKTSTGTGTFVLSQHTSEAVGTGASALLQAYDAFNPYIATSPTVNLNSPNPPVGMLSANPTQFSDNALTENVTLSNIAGGTSITWTASSSLAGVTFSPSSGTLEGGATQNVTITIPSGTVSSTTFVFNATNNSVTVGWTYGSGGATAQGTFITRRNGTLYYGSTSSQYTFSGANIYWLGLAEKAADGTQNVHYPTLFHIADALKTAKEMGATAVRSHTLGISVGNQYSVCPTLTSLTSPNTQAFQTIDYAIYTAGQLGLRLIIPLIDNWHYYHGGKHTFTDWRSVTESAFYSNSTVINDFKTYIALLLNHVNQYNGLAYKQDPTIMAWETGNELQSPNPGATWTTTIANYIKSLAPNQLVMDGTGGGVDSGNFSIASVDLYTDHFYPPSISTAQANAAAVNTANKCYVIGEYDWTNNVGGTATMTLDTTTTPTGGGSQSLKVVVAQAASQDYFDQLQYNSPITITSGHTYTISFYAKSTTPYTTSNPMNVGLQQNHDGYTIYTSRSFATTNSWTNYSWTYTASATDTNCVLYFNFGLVASTTNLDLVSIVDSANSGVNLLSNPSFENNTIDPWYNNNTVIDSLSSFLSAIESTPSIDGDLFWQMQPHDDAYGFVKNTEVYTMYYPGIANGSLVTTSDMQTRSQVLRTHAYTVQGRTPPPSASTDVPLTAPLLTSVTPTQGANVIAWRGVVGAAMYLLESNTTGTWTTLASGLTDASTPYSDTSAPVNVSYRVTPYNMDGVAGPTSAVSTLGTTVSTPGVLSVSPTNFTSKAPSVVVTLTNTGGTTINWYSACVLSGVTFSPATGTLAPNASQQVTVTVPSDTMQNEYFLFYWL